MRVYFNEFLCDFDTILAINFWILAIIGAKIKNFYGTNKLDFYVFDSKRLKIYLSEGKKAEIAIIWTLSIKVHLLCTKLFYIFASKSKVYGR